MDHGVSEFGRYTLVERLPCEGAVERFRGIGPSGPVEIVRLLPQLARRKSAVDAFLGAGSQLLGLTGPGIQTTIDVGLIRDVPFMVFEWIDGTSLTRVLESDGSLSAEEVEVLLRDLSISLDRAHLSGPVLHRAITPEHVLIDSNGSARLVQFGLSHALSAVRPSDNVLVVSSLPFSAPEYAQTGSFTPACDVFALGVTIVLALTGEHPFSATSPLKTAERIADGDMDALPDELELSFLMLLESLLVPDPAQRPSAPDLLAKTIGFENTAARTTLSRRVANTRGEARRSTEEVRLPEYRTKAPPKRPSAPPMLASTPHYSLGSAPRGPANDAPRTVFDPDLPFFLRNSKVAQKELGSAKKPARAVGRVPTILRTAAVFRNARESLTQTGLQKLSPHVSVWHSKPAVAWALGLFVVFGALLLAFGVSIGLALMI